MSKFKVGEAKTKGGHDAYIFEITEERIFGKINDEGWISTTWRGNGEMQTNLKCYDLLPNNEQLRAEFEYVVKYHTIYDSNSTMHERCYVQVPSEFKGMCVKVTLESPE